MKTHLNFEAEYALVNHLIDDLEHKLSGRHQTRILRIVPSDHCHLGVLGPRDPNVEETEYIEFDDNLITKNNSIEIEKEQVNEQHVFNNQKETRHDFLFDNEQVDAEKKGYVRDSVRRPPSSMGFDIVVESDDSDLIKLIINIEFSIYTQHFPSYQEQKQEIGNQVFIKEGIDNSKNNSGTVSLLEVFVRRDVKVPPIAIEINPSKGRQQLSDGGVVQKALDLVLDGAISDPSIWRKFSGKSTVPIQKLSSQEVFEAYMHEFASGPVLRPPLKAKLDVRILPISNGKVRICCYLCNDTHRDVINPYRDQHNILADCKVKGTIEKGKLLPIELIPVPKDYQFNREVWAVGHGANVHIDNNQITTETLARFEQPRRTTKLQPKAYFVDLCEDPFSCLEKIRCAMVNYANEWKEKILRNELSLDPEGLEQCRKDWQAFCDEKERFSSGIAALNTDKKLLNAFISMNKIFSKTAEGKYDSWHLFQIIFIVTQLPSLAIREKNVEGDWPEGVKHNWANIQEWADVLWFPTGGGKTEAYLGLICCAALYDRLRGKNFGVTAWLRFPLRMLSVQQLQRAMKVIWEAEQERKRLLGVEMENSDPISLGYFVGGSSTPNSLNKEYLRTLEEDKQRKDKLLLVNDCPACNGEKTITLELDDKAMRIRHVCSKCKAELPVYVSDEEIYRFLPTLIIGTIDKMATIAYNPRFSMLWGGASWRCQEHEHGYSMGQWCGVFGCQKKGRRVNIKPYDPCPSFHIQDELHLLQQELGAFAGHYETLVRSCEIAVGEGLPPKIIAATATIEGFEHQIRQIYGVPNARRFPTRGFNLLETFYTMADKISPINRMYVAFRPPRLHAADAASLSVRILQEEIMRLYENPGEAIKWMPNINTEEEVKRLLFYYSTILVYVGSKSRGVRVRQALERSAGELRPGNIRDLNTEFISGNSTLATIADTIKKVEKPPTWIEEDYLDITVATSVVSHGVDVERFNLMVMDSIPEEAAEYIQASSRSGRKHLGLVLSILPSYSLRATSIYHRFKEYHKHLERLISPVSVNRFAKFAAKRTSSGIFIGLILGKYGAKQKSTDYMTRNKAAELLACLSTEEFQKAFEDAYALGQGIYPKGLEIIMRQDLIEYINQLRFQIIRESRHKKIKDILKPKPMTSLRDVDVGVIFQPDENVDWRELRWFDIFE